MITGTRQCALRSRHVEHDYRYGPEPGVMKHCEGKGNEMGHVPGFGDGDCNERCLPGPSGHHALAAQAKTAPGPQFPGSMADAAWEMEYGDDLQISAKPRITDAIRQVTIDRLNRAFIDGALDQDVLDARLGAALNATTQAQLTRLESDLPQEAVTIVKAPAKITQAQAWEIRHPGIPNPVSPSSPPHDRRLLKLLLAAGTVPVTFVVLGLLLPGMLPLLISGVVLLITWAWVFGGALAFVKSGR